MELACQGEGLEAHKVIIGFMEDVQLVGERDMVEAVQDFSCWQVSEAPSPIFSKGVGARICSGGLMQWNWRCQ